MEIEYPRFIHSEFMTHRVFSRNAASSRAIPIDVMMQQVRERPAMPIHWGANKPGMQADNQVEDTYKAELAWCKASKRAVKSAEKLNKLGLHKQVVNRVLEPFQTMKTVVTSTDWCNFFELRTHKDAQPEIRRLAGLMSDAMIESSPMAIADLEWHVPYVGRYRNNRGIMHYYVTEEGLVNPTILTADEALKVSASCCAQTSYRKNDQSSEKALRIYDRLINSKPVHASPFEHQATPSNNKDLWGNFQGFNQYRKELGF